MKVLFILLIILSFVFPLYAEESKVYTDEDLKSFGSGSKSSSDLSDKNPCKIYENLLDRCREKDYECKMEWETKLQDCLLEELDYMTTGRRPVKVKIVP